ncbi:MAG: hypothetical protein NW223_23385 [Hyphomicrobiaceae bacterium]|nr:hypothetical protein [Hyphomicrobiaceae bacterium]
MKAIVLILALLVAAKLGYQEYLFRIAAQDAMVAAYRERAAQACQKDARGTQMGISPLSWSNPASIRLQIGRSGVDVHFWQVDDERWAARYRNPYLLLSAGARHGIVHCEYDIVNAQASVTRM